MKQRLAIAATLLEEPDLLILDEPTNGLDPAGIREIREIRDTIRSLGESGMTVLLNSHLLAEVQQVCTVEPPPSCYAENQGGRPPAWGSECSGERELSLWSGTAYYGTALVLTAGVPLVSFRAARGALTAAPGPAGAAAYSCLL